MQKKMLKRLFIAILMLFPIMFAVNACAESGQGQVHVTYNIVGNGKIYVERESGLVWGGQEQALNKGMDSFPVAAVADHGYFFSEWSDGLKGATRQEKNIRSNLTITAYFEKGSFNAIYSAGANGSISGKESQSVLYTEYSESVEAVPEKGYMFVGWSDGAETAIRRDLITDDLNVTAYFDIAAKTFAYDYHYATGNNAEQSVTLRYDNLGAASFAVPEKEYSEFGGWYLDKARTVQVSDKNGNLTIGQDIFDSASNTLYAKWTATEDIPPYKILMVFVEEIDATFQTHDGESINLHYKLTPLERQICEILTIKFSTYLNELFYGYVTFEIDNYFTTEILGSECFTLSRDSFGRMDCILRANRISEIGLMLNNYRSVIATSFMNDYEFLFHYASGSANIKYATVHLESLFQALVINKIPLETLLDSNSIHWYLGTYLHEFAHTVERAGGGSIENNYYDYHNMLGHYNTLRIPTLEATNLYLLNQAVIDGERVGIPFDFWKGNIDVLATYSVQRANDEVLRGGFINEQYQTNVYAYVPYGSDFEVTAIPREGYRFVKWSDGVTTATRRDTNIISLIDVYAIFEKE